MQACLGEEPLPPLRSRKGEWLLALLALLALRGAAISRSWLAGTLWPESEESRALLYLRRELTYLRKALGQECDRLISAGRSLHLDLAGADCDLLAFDAAIARGDESSLEVAVSLYGGPLLEGCAEEWVILERDSREQAYIGALEKLAEWASARGDLATAGSHLRAVVAIDPLRETAQRALLQALAGQGDYAAAVRSYRDLRLRLHSELNIEPDPETTALFRGIRERASIQASRLPATPSGPPVRRIPSPLTELVGRRDELREIAAAVASSRLVTLTGAGGVGKTRLAIQTADALADGFPQGAWFIDLAAISEPELLPQAVAGALEIRPDAGATLVDAICDSLRPKRILIVLDNCEQILDASARLTGRLLDAGPGVRILATSRQSLGITGEIAWRVPSLEVPPGQAEPDRNREKDQIAALMEFASVRLFVERAGLANPSFKITSSNHQEVSGICRRLDGIPLAIELAAARLKTLSATELARRLDDRFDLLTTGSRTAMPRQQTLQAAIVWSFDLLTVAERELLKRLTVFNGSWSLAAAEAVCSGDGLEQSAILDLLSALVDKSLVLSYVQEEEGRYRFLETVREFGREELGDSERAAIQTRHAEYYLTLVKASIDEIDGQQYGRWMRLYNRELHNLRAAIESSIQAGDGDRALGISYRLQRYWTDTGSQAEGRRWIRRALDVGAPSHSRVRSRALKVIGILAFEQADYDAALAAHEEALAIHESTGDREAVASTQNDLGSLAHRQGEYERARRHFNEALAVNQDLGLSLCVAMNLGNLGMLSTDCGDFEQALPLLEEGCERAKSVGAPRVIPGFLGALGALLRRTGRNERAQAVLEEALALTRETGNHSWEPLLLTNLGILALERGETGLARRHLEQSLLIAGPAGDRREIACALEAIADLESRVGEPERALHYYSASANLRSSIRSPLPPCDAAQYDSAMHSLRIRLGSESFDRSWVEGQSLSLDRVIELVVDG